MTQRTSPAKTRQRSEKRARHGARRPLWLRLVRWALIVVVVLILIPAILTPLYRVVAPLSVPMIARWASGEEVRWDWVAFDQIAPDLVRAVLASEDNFYCRHRGVDWGAVREVIETGADRGASTIAMQTARNLFLWQSRSYVRKALELPLAYYADLVLGKRRLLEIYLNIAEWGPGVYGIGAAARHHFGVAPADLTLRQATLLAVTLPNPAVRNPANPGATADRLARIIAGRVAAGPDVSCLGL